MRFLVDEQVYACLAVYLRFLGHDAQAVVKEREADLRGERDEVVLEVASAEDRVVVTFNTDDYVRLGEQYRRDGCDHPGIILSPQRGYRDFEVVFRSVDRLLEEVPPDQFPNQLHYLGPYMR